MDYETARARLIEHLREEIGDEPVLEAMSRIPRELFVPPAERSAAYEDRPLPIGYGQTISQPYIIALMTSMLEITGGEKVLEVGTGSGYQAAILAELAQQVVTVERLPALAETAKLLLRRLGYKNISVRLAEPALGWQLEAPYDAIMVTAGAPEIPQTLIKQLKNGGRMVIPVGSRYEQELYRITRKKDGNVIQRMGGCRFVSLIGDEAWADD